MFVYYDFFQLLTKFSLLIIQIILYKSFSPVPIDIDTKKNLYFFKEI